MRQMKIRTGSQGYNHKYNVVERRKMNLYETNKARQNEIKKAVEILRQKLSEYPEGALKIYQGKKRLIYKHYKARGDFAYISVKQQELIAALAGKQILEQRLRCLENEKRGLEKYLECFDGGEAYENYLNENSEMRRLAEIGGEVIQSEKEGKRGEGLAYLDDERWLRKVSAEEWTYKLLQEHTIKDKGGNIRWDYNGSNDALYQEARNKKTKCGVWVRSKSEAMIANALYEAGILFLYEPSVRVGNKVYNPDFLIFLFSGKIVIHEHAGILFDTEKAEFYSELEKDEAIKYTNNFSGKVYNYIQNGWIPNINFTITSETKFQPFDSTFFDSLIENLYLA